MNGDLVTQADLGALIDAHVASGAVATIGMRRYVHTVPFGCVERDGDRVTALVEKPAIVREVNSGIYVLEPDAASAASSGTCRSTLPDLSATPSTAVSSSARSRSRTTGSTSAIATSCAKSTGG